MQSSVFDRVVEQEKVIQQLKISAANPLHAYFFVGRGVRADGKQRRGLPL